MKFCIFKTENEGNTKENRQSLHAYVHSKKKYSVNRTLEMGSIQNSTDACYFSFFSSVHYFFEDHFVLRNVFGFIFLMCFAFFVHRPMFWPRINCLCWNHLNYWNSACIKMEKNKSKDEEGCLWCKQPFLFVSICKLLRSTHWSKLFQVKGNSITMHWNYSIRIYVRAIGVSL